jgi:hypothetical protein
VLALARPAVDPTTLRARELSRRAFLSNRAFGRPQRRGPTRSRSLPFTRRVTRRTP